MQQLAVADPLGVRCCDGPTYRTYAADGCIVAYCSCDVKNYTCVYFSCRRCSADLFTGVHSSSRVPSVRFRLFVVFIVVHALALPGAAVASRLFPLSSCCLQQSLRMLSRASRCRPAHCSFCLYQLGHLPHHFRDSSGRLALQNVLSHGTSLLSSQHWRSPSLGAVLSRSVRC